MEEGDEGKRGRGIDGREGEGGGCDVLEGVEWRRLS